MRAESKQPASNRPLLFSLTLLVAGLLVLAAVLWLGGAQLRSGAVPKPDPVESRL